MIKKKIGLVWLTVLALAVLVITSYSIHYTKLYEAPAVQQQHGVARAARHGRQPVQP